MAAGLILPAAVGAGPLNPKVVSADAKWVAHVDFAALNDTKAVREVRDIWPKKTEKAREWMQENYGIDTREDFESATAYGSSYGKGDCVVVLKSDYSEDKVHSRIESQEDVKTTEWRGHKIYTCQASKMKSKHHKADSNDEKKDASSSDYKSDSKWGDKSDRVAWVLVDDETIVYSKSVRSLKDAVETLEGHAESLEGKESELTADIPDNAVVYAAAVELDSISHEGAMFPLLRQHKRACYALGEKDGELFDELKLVARNEKVAEKMEKVVEGYAAAMKVMFIDSEPMSKMLENVEIEQDNATVKTCWNGDVDRFAEALKDCKKNMKR